MPGAKHLQYIDHVRGLAILLIVSIHTRAAFGWANVYEERFWFSILVYGTIVFVFISGFLFQYLHRESFSFWPYFQRKLRFVVVPYLIVSVPAIVNKLWFDQSEAWHTDFYRSLPDAGQAAYMILTGKHIGPFWFIPMIVLIYLLSPVLIFLDRRTWFYSYVFPLIFLGGLLLHNFGHNSNTIEALLYFLPVYMLGMCASRYREVVEKLTLLQLAPLIAVYLLIFALEMNGTLAIGKTYGFNENARENSYLFNFGKLKMTLLCIILVSIFSRRGPKPIPWLQLMASYSFGIYFIHLYVLRASEKLVVVTTDGFLFNTVSFLIYVAVITATSLGVVHVVKLVTGKASRYFIGS